MKTTELVAQTILKATGKPSSLTSADTKWAKIVGIANGLISQWESEPGVDWNSLYDPEYEVGTLSATNSIEFDNSEVRKISDTTGDCLRIYHPTDSSYLEYTFVRPEQLKQLHGNYVAQVGNTLRFQNAFKSDNAFIGGRITMPVYTYASTLKNENSTVPVDIPRWLVVMSAAEYVRNDITKQNQYGNLVQEANQLMERMIDDNNAQVEFVYSPWTPGV